MAFLTNCFFCGKDFVVPSGDKYFKLEGYEDLKIFDDYKAKMGEFFSLEFEYCCEDCFYKKIMPEMNLKKSNCGTKGRPTKNNVIICAEASAVHLKNVIVDFLAKEGYDFKDATERDNLSYIEAGSIIGESISKGEYTFGIVLCGSGMGVNLVANRFPGVYCGLCESLHTAKMARTITNCNVLALGGNIVAYDLACRMVKVFLDTDFGETFSDEAAVGLREMFAVMEKVDKETHKG